MLSLHETISYIGTKILESPSTYLNIAAIAVSFTDLEAAIKIFLYMISISTSLLLAVKYGYEIKKLRKDNENETKL